jgi:hypothetical protein
MKRAIQTIILSLVLISCDQNVNDDLPITKQSIQGDWVEILEPKNGHLFSNDFEITNGFGFQGDSIELMAGIRWNEFDSLSGVDKEIYHGNYTTYELKKDTIWILDPKDFIQKRYFEILYQGKDTLKISFFNQDTLLYKKIKYYSVEHFDEIKFERTFCFGTCPVYKINLKRDGSLVYEGIEYVDSIGKYKAVLNTDQIHFIFNKFKKAFGIINEKTYSSGGTDNYTITTKLYKDGVEINSVSDYGAAGPPSLIWTYIVMEDLRKFVDWKKCH